MLVIIFFGYEISNDDNLVQVSSILMFNIQQIWHQFLSKCP